MEGVFNQQELSATDPVLMGFYKRALNALKEHKFEPINFISASVDDIQSLYVSASMNIGMTLESVKPLLEYKQEVSRRILGLSNPDHIDTFAGIMSDIDDKIEMLLGIQKPKSRS